MTQRGFSAENLAAIQAGKVFPALFVEGLFYVADDSPSDYWLRLWTGVGPIEWGGRIWTGGGNLLGFSKLDESAETRAIGFTVLLSGMPSDLVSLALQSTRIGYPVKIYLGLFDSAEGALVADPHQVRAGRFDLSVIEDSGETCTISAQYEDRLVDLERTRDRRYTQEDQAFEWPGDLGFEFVPILQDAQLIWGGPGAGSSRVANPGNSSDVGEDSAYGD